MSYKEQVPFVFNPERKSDNLETLTAGFAARPEAITVEKHAGPKYFWVNNFGGRPADYLEWTVRSNLADTTDYYAWLHISANQGSQFRITVSQGGNSTVTDYTKPSGEWEVAEFGIIKIPAGVSTIRLEMRSLAAEDCLIKGLNMIRESDRAAYLGRVAAYRRLGQDIKTKFSNSDYGLFFQCGVWGYPEHGAKKSMEDSTNDFDAHRFVTMLKNTNAKFVIWSITWWRYQMQMPVAAVDAITGDSSLTTRRNLVGEIAGMCKKEGIDFYLYYHHGVQQEPSWAAKQNWPDNGFDEHGMGDRTVFFDNWEKVVSEIGTTLGADLDGWFFDDGCSYYPAPFERLAAAAKTGNSKRILSYNSWVGTKVTDFQDVIFGEDVWGTASDTTGGIYNSGKEKGLLQMSMKRINDGNWGVTGPDETIDLITDAGTIIANIKAAHDRNVPTALNIKVWDDGSTGRTTFDALLEVKEALSR
jgi:hypothetical protein